MSKEYFEMCKRDAAKGDPCSISHLAAIYFFGYSTRRNYKEAVRLYTIALEAFDAMDIPIEVPKDEDYDQRFDYDREYYTCRMGIWYLNGYGGLKKDFNKALELIEKSATMGRREAQKFLKTIKNKGNPDESEALEGLSMVEKDGSFRYKFSDDDGIISSFSQNLYVTGNLKDGITEAGFID